MKLHLNHITADSPEDLSSWTPPDKYDVLEFIRIGIGSSKKTADDFFLKVATPKGLARSSPLNGVLASRPLVVFEYFDYDLLRNWIEEILKSCEDEDWPKSVEKLRRHFNWEYDNYKVY